MVPCYYFQFFFTRVMALQQFSTMQNRNITYPCQLRQLETNVPSLPVASWLKKPYKMMVMIKWWHHKMEYAWIPKPPHRQLLLICIRLFMSKWWTCILLNYENYFFMYLFLLLCIEEHLGSFHFGAIINTAAIKIHIQVFVWP